MRTHPSTSSTARGWIFRCWSGWRSFFFFERFFIISLLSFLIQKNVKNFITIEFLDYISQRLFFSGLFFLIGYFFHITFTFKKVGPNIQIIQKNLKFRAEKDSAIFKAINIICF